MPTVKYIVEESSLRLTADGYQATNVFLVTGATGSGVARHYNAVLAPEIPRYGDPHPAVPGIFAQSIGVNPEDTRQFKISVEYARPQFNDPGNPDVEDDQPVNENDRGSLEIWSTTRDIETAFDSDGNKITVSYTYPSDDEHGRAGKTETQGGVVTVPVPASGIRITRNETFFGFDLLNLAGTINSSSWNGFLPRTVLFLGRTIRLTRIDRSKVIFEASYDFQIQSNWKSTVAFRDPETGNVPPDLEEGVGYKNVDVYRLGDFDRLNLRFIT